MGFMKYVLLSFTLLLGCVIGGCSAENESTPFFLLDEALKESDLPIAIVQELPIKGHTVWQMLTKTSNEWRPLRIMASILDLNDTTKYCNESGVIRPDLHGDNFMCTEDSILTFEKKNLIIHALIPEAVRLHTTRLLVESLNAKILIPLFTDPLCSSFTVPPEHQTVGVQDADMILYAAARPAPHVDIAWAKSCARLSNGRPVAGVINFAPHSLTLSRVSIRITAHEIAHTLGFNYPQMIALQMVTVVPNVRGKPFALLVNSSLVREKTREFYGCPTAAGMELEDDGGAATAGSHWKRRNAKDELMAPMGSAGMYYTAMTMAMFEDMQFYKGNWGMEEKMAWGEKAGCALLEERCVVNNRTAFPHMFCNETGSNTLRCTSDRLALGSCSLTSYNTSIPEIYQYFSNSMLGGNKDDLMDYCPLIVPYEDSQCSDGEKELLPGSRISIHSRCFTGDNLVLYNKPVGDVCVEVSCSDGEVSVRYLGDDNWYPCPEGGYITPTKTFSSGRILCPMVHEVCDNSNIVFTSVASVLLSSLMFFLFLL